jgi:hypothetical protein
MGRPPAVALALGLAGLIPFVWGALTVLNEPLAAWGMRALGPRFVGPHVGLAFGTVILAFMSGVLWGLATRAGGAVAATGQALSVIPALWAFVMITGGPTAAGLNLMAGFAGLLLLDLHFVRAGLAPAWWMPMRLGLTAIVILSLVPVVL